MFSVLEVESDNDDYDDDCNGGIFEAPSHSWDIPQYGHNMLGYVNSDSRSRCAEQDESVGTASRAISDSLCKGN